MPNPYTIHIFVADGDPSGIRIINRMNWTGCGLVFRRSDWDRVRKRAEMKNTGIYILVGFGDEDDERPTLYIGQADGVQDRIDLHHKKKDFWDWAAVFVSTSGGLNRAHVTWLEYALIERAVATNQCLLDNANAPKEPALSEAEKADTQGFMDEILQILPLVGLRSLEFPKAISVQQNGLQSDDEQYNTIIVPAREGGFEDVFLGQDCWYAIHIAGGRLDKIKYIAAYQTQPVSAITHYAPVARIEPYGEHGKYKVVFSEPAIKIGPINFEGIPIGGIRSPRYTTFSRLKKATKIQDILVTS